MTKKVPERLIFYVLFVDQKITKKIDDILVTFMAGSTNAKCGLKLR